MVVAGEDDKVAGFLEQAGGQMIGACDCSDHCDGP